MAKKKQGTLKGLERPTIEELDTLCGELIEAENEVALWKDKASQKKAALHLKMDEHRKALEKDSKGQPIHVYQDGELQETFVLAQSEVIRHRKAKKAGDDDKGGEIE